MRKMDEMERDIQLRAEERGYKAALTALCAWNLFNMYHAFANGAKLDMLPCWVLCLSICVQGFSHIAMRQRMVSGDEEYKEPNTMMHTIIAAIVVVIVALSVGAYFMLGA